MSKTVYLCGAINGCADDECRTWREQIKPLLAGCVVLDPMARDYRGKEDKSVAEIVDGDIADIDASDTLIVNAARPSWGTAMEIFYAFRSGKQVLLIVPEGSCISPWLRYHSHHIVHSLQSAAEAALP